MTGIIICKSVTSRVTDISAILENEKGYPFEVVLFESVQEVNLLSYDYVVAEWKLRQQLFWTLRDNPQMEIAFFNEVFVMNLDDIDGIKNIIEMSMQSRNWEVCKGMNEFLLFGDIIRRRGKMNAYPRKFQIETTDLCNAKCIMCSHAYSYGSGVDIFETGILDRLEPYLPFVNTIVLHGNGEPFLKPNIVRYLDSLAQYGIRFVTNTNLSIINDNILESLKHNFDEISVSCDGHYKELYESIRVGLKFDTFVENVSLVRKSCPNLYMNMAVVVMRQNLAYLDQIVEFAADLGFQEVQFNQLCVDPRCNNLEDSPILYKAEYIAAIKKVIDVAKTRNIIVRYPDISELKDKENEAICVEKDESAEHSANQDDYKAKVIFEGVCDWLVGSPFINLRGDIGICCINSRNLVGNIFANDFEDIWNSENYCAMRENFYKGNMPSWCLGCDFLMQGRLEFMQLVRADMSALQKRIRES